MCTVLSDVNGVHICELTITAEVRKRGELYMMELNKMYLSATDVANILGVSKGYAYRVIRELNTSLKEKGFIVVAGKIPTKYFEKRFYGFEIGKEK